MRKLENTQEVWSHIWQEDLTKETAQNAIEQEAQSARYERIINAVKRTFGKLTNLRAVEVGSGMGTYSYLFHREGAEVTLLDRNKDALKAGKKFFDFLGGSAQFVECDALKLPRSLANSFDIAMSFGLAEHFLYPERLEIFKAHVDLVREGGMVIISVPNSLFLPYRVGKFLLEITGKWEIGLEVPFSPRELSAVASKLGLKKFEIIGSSISGDFLNFWLIQRFIKLPGFVLDKALGAMGFRNNGITPLSQRMKYLHCEWKTFWDRYFGYSIILIGQK